MGYYVVVPIIALLVAIQSSVLPFFRWYSGQPNLVLLLVVAWAVYASLEESLFLAFLGGIAQDLLSVQPLGTSVIPLVVVVFVIATVRAQLYAINFLLVLGFVALATFVQQIVSLVILSQVGFGSDLISYIRYVTLPTLAYNSALILPVYWFVGWFARRTPRGGFRYSDER